MSTPDAIHVRLDGLENAITKMSDRVGAMAEFVQRLVVLEERNSHVTEQVKETKETFKENVAKLEEANKELKEKLELENASLKAKIDSLNEKVIRLVALCSILTSVVTTVAPHLLRKFVGV